MSRFTEQLQLLRREVAQQEILCGSKENTLRAEIEQLKTRITRKKQLIAKSQVRAEWLTFVWFLWWFKLYSLKFRRSLSLEFIKSNENLK